MIISEPLKRALKETGVSAAELARRMGKNRAYISQLTSGTLGVTEENLGVIAKHLGCTVSIDIQFKRIE